MMLFAGCQLKSVCEGAKKKSRESGRLRVAGSVGVRARQAGHGYNEIETHQLQISLGSARCFQSCGGAALGVKVDG